MTEVPPYRWFDHREVACLHLRLTSRPLPLVLFTIWLCKRGKDSRVKEMGRMGGREWLMLLGYRTRHHGTGMEENEVRADLDLGQRNYANHLVWNLVQPILCDLLVLTATQRAFYDCVVLTFPERFAKFQRGRVGYPEERLQYLERVIPRDHNDHPLRYEDSKAKATT